MVRQQRLRESVGLACDDCGGGGGAVRLAGGGRGRGARGDVDALWTRQRTDGRSAVVGQKMECLSEPRLLGEAACMLDVAATRHLKRGQTQLLQPHLRPVVVVCEADRVYRLGIITLLTYYA